MFTGFASENTPAIQVWDFFRAFASATAVRSVSLPDDCAPIQVFRAGGASSSIRVYLPTAPIEGKQITIVNQQYGGNAQRVEIYSSDRSGAGSSTVLYQLGAADSIILVYSKQNITLGTNGFAATGWISLNKSSLAAGNAYAAILGGDNNDALGLYSFVGGGNANTASGLTAAVVGGDGNTASGEAAAVIGGSGNTANDTYCFVAGGNGNNSQAFGAGILAGSGNTANGTKSSIIGGAYGTTRSIVGNFVYTASNDPFGLFVTGRAQNAVLTLARQTTDATPTVLRSNTSAASTTNQVILPNNSAYIFQGTVIAARTAAGDTSSWKFEGAIKRGANAASTTLVAAVTPTVIAQDAGAAAWVLAITADTTNGGIAVTVTGAAATTIRWVCRIETTEVTF